MSNYKISTPKSFKNVHVTVSVPGSKSITNRALIVAALSDGPCILKGCQFSDDSKNFINCLKQLGFRLKERGTDVTVYGCGGRIPEKKAGIYVGSAGTAARFLTAMLAVSDGEYEVNCSEQMKKRPMAPLFDALRSMGAEISCLEKEGHLPVRIIGRGHCDTSSEKIDINVDITESSQFLSALLIVAPLLGKNVKIGLTGSHGLKYADMTVAMMESFGVKAVRNNGNYIINPGTYSAEEYRIEPDVSAAAYFYSLAALTGCSVTVENVTLPSLQGDVKLLDILKKMGCDCTTCVEQPDSTNNINNVIVKGPTDSEGYPLKLKGGFTADLSEFSDQALTLAVLAAYADSPITITGIAHIKKQESDRINSITENLSTLGIKTESGEDYVTIYPGETHGGEIQTFEDHRVAMAFSLAGLKTPGVTILDKECCGKTFKEYFEVFDEVLNTIRQE